MNDKIRLFKSLYIVISNMLILIAVTILTFHFIILLRYSYVEKNYYSALSDEQKSAYSHLSQQQVNDLLRNTWAVNGGGWEYEKWLGFKEAARKSNFVNVNEFGIRANSRNQVEMKDINNAVWMFGGSTTFGYGVADSETIPAFLEKKLNKVFINFGRGYFYSAQENALLRQFLKAGYFPKEVFFLDGINERCDIDVYQDDMKLLFKKNQLAYNWRFSEIAMPLIFISNKIKGNILKKRKKAFSSECYLYGSKNSLADILKRNLLERKNLCEQYGLKCITFVQPFAGLHGVHKDYASLSQDNRDYFRNKFNYLNNTWMLDGAVFLTNALDQYQNHAFVDNCHYSIEANKMIADAIIMNLK